MWNECQVIQIILGVSSGRFAFFRTEQEALKVVMILRPGRRGHSSAFGCPGSGHRASVGSSVSDWRGAIS